MSAVGLASLTSKAILTPSEWGRANEGALRRHDEALRASLDSSLRLIRSIADDACTCPDGLIGVCPVCRCRVHLGTPALPRKGRGKARPRLPQPDSSEWAE